MRTIMASEKSCLLLLISIMIKWTLLMVAVVLGETLCFRCDFKQKRSFPPEFSKRVESKSNPRGTATCAPRSMSVLAIDIRINGQLLFSRRKLSVKLFASNPQNYPPPFFFSALNRPPAMQSGVNGWVPTSYSHSLLKCHPYPKRTKKYRS